MSLGNSEAYLAPSTGPELAGAGAGLGTTAARVVGDATGKGFGGGGGATAPCRRLEGITDSKRLRSSASFALSNH